MVSRQRYPEHDKLEAIQAASQAQGELLEWLNEQSIQLCRIPEGYEHTWFPIHEPFDDLLARYHGIDLAKLESEKRAMLERLEEFIDAEAHREAVADEALQQQYEGAPR